MSAMAWLTYICLALVMGGLGQLVRVAVGLKKLRDSNALKGVPTPFDNKKFWISMVLGSLAGMVAAIAAWDASEPLLSREFLMMIVAAGYSGSDLIEGIIEKWVKKLPA